MTLTKVEGQFTCQKWWSPLWELGTYDRLGPRISETSWQIWEACIEHMNEFLVKGHALLVQRALGYISSVLLWGISFLQFLCFNFISLMSWLYFNFKDTYDHWFAGGIGTLGVLHLSRSDFEWRHLQVRGVLHAWHLLKPILHAHHLPATITTGQPPTHYVFLGFWEDLLFIMFSLPFIFNVKMPDS